MSFSSKIVITILGIIIVAGIVVGVMWQGRGQRSEEPQKFSEPQGPVQISIDFPKESYKVGEDVLKDKAGHYKVKPVEDKIKGVLLLKFSRVGVDKVKYPRKKEYEVPVTGERRKYLKEKVRKSVSEEEFQKRLKGHISGTLRAFLLNNSKYRAYKRGFPEKGEYIYTLAFYSCSDIKKELGKDSCFQPLASAIDKNVGPQVQDSQTIKVTP